MRLGDLAATVDDADVTGFALDHRQVAPGNVFGAFAGARFNGEDYIADAVARGAVAIVARPQAKVIGAAHLGTEQCGKGDRDQHCEGEAQRRLPRLHRSRRLHPPGSRRSAAAACSAASAPRPPPRAR